MTKEEYSTINGIAYGSKKKAIVCCFSCKSTMVKIGFMGKGSIPHTSIYLYDCTNPACMCMRSVVEMEE